MKLEQIRQAVHGHEAEMILPEHPRFTAVLIPLVERGGELQVLCQVRSQSVDPPGEVSFPGGHVEPGESAAETAVREACEDCNLGAFAKTSIRFLSQGQRKRVALADAMLLRPRLLPPADWPKTYVIYCAFFRRRPDEARHS